MDKLLNYFSFLNEKKKEDARYEYGCLMLNFELIDKKWNDVLKKIDKDDIFIPTGRKTGLEKECHITLMYGFTGKIDMKRLIEITKDFIFPEEIILSSVSFFECPEFDVLKFDALNIYQLYYANNRLRELPFENKFPVYQPHVTISYLKKGTAEKYTNLNIIEPIKIKFTDMTYSYPDKKKKKIKLSKNEINKPK